MTDEQILAIEDRSTGDISATRTMDIVAFARAIISARDAELLEGGYLSETYRHTIESNDRMDI